MMRKFTIGVLSAFAIFSTGCCLRVGDARMGVNCCGVKDSEKFVAEEKTTSVVATDTVATAIAPKENGLLAAIGIGVGIAALVGWNAYKAIQKKKAAAVSDAADK